MLTIVEYKCFSVATSIAICLLSLVHVPHCLCAAVTGDLERLIDASRAMKENAELILTWEGEGVVTDHRLQDGQLEIESLARVEFACDRLNDSIRWNFDVYNEGLATEQLTYVSSNMWRDGEAVEFGPNYAVDDKKRWNAYLSAERQASEVLTNDYDPMFFTRVTRDESLSIFLLNLYKEWSKSEDSLDHIDCTIQDDEGLFIVDFRGPSYFNTFVFDPDYSYCLARFTAGGGEVEETWEFKYVKPAGVSVPSSWTYVNSSLMEGVPSIVFRRRFEILNQAINQPIPSNTFSLESMGMRVGDLLTDNVRGGQYVIGDRWELKDLDSGLRSEASLDTSNKGKFYLILINVAIVTVLIIWVAYRHTAGRQR